MSPENFVFWLNGYFELGGENLSPQQVQIIKDHLALVFNKVTPSYDVMEKANKSALNTKNKFPDYYVGYPNPIPMFDERNEDGTKKPQRYC